MTWSRCGSTPSSWPCEYCSLVLSEASYIRRVPPSKVAPGGGVVSGDGRDGGVTGPTDVRRNSSLVVVGTSAARAMALDALRPPGRRGTLQGLDRLGLPNASPLLVRHC